MTIDQIIIRTPGIRKAMVGFKISCMKRGIRYQNELVKLLEKNTR